MTIINYLCESRVRRLAKAQQFSVFYPLVKTNGNWYWWSSDQLPSALADGYKVNKSTGALAQGFNSIFNSWFAWLMVNVVELANSVDNC